MKVLKAYPKGLTEPIEWTLDDDVDPDVTARELAQPPHDLITIHTATGWVMLEPAAYAAFEVVTT